MKKLIFIMLFGLLSVSGWGQGGNNCYILKGQFSGKTNLYNQTLFDTVCALIETVDNAVSKTSTTRYSSDFKIISYDLYPTTSFMDDKIDFDSQTDWALNDIQTDNHNEYIAVLKSITNNSIEYHVRLKLPPAGVFSTLNPVETEAIQNKIEGIMNASYLVFRTNWMAEIAGYAYLFSVVEDLMNGTFAINEFDDSDFVELEYPSFNLTKTGESYSENNIFDYCGLKDSTSFIRDAILGSSPSPIPTIGRPTYILTSNLCSSYSTIIAEAENKFKESSSPVTIWLHYQQENGVVKTYMKTKTNVSEALRQNVLQSVIDQAYYETISNLEDAINNVSSLDFDSEEEDNDDDFPAFQGEPDSLQSRITGNCDFGWNDVLNIIQLNEAGYEKLKNFSFKKCYVDPEVANDRITDINFTNAIVQNRYYYHKSDVVPFFVTGGIYGMGDGLKDVIVMVWGICNYVGDLKPGSTAYFNKLNELHSKGAICVDELKSNHKQLKIIQNDLYNTFKTLYNNKDKIYEELVIQLKTAVHQSASHPKWGGYYAGYLAFDVLLTSTTAGASKAISSSRLVTSISSKVKSSFTSSVKKINLDFPNVKKVVNSTVESVYDIKKATYENLLKKWFIVIMRTWTREYHIFSI